MKPIQWNNSGKDVDSIIKFYESTKYAIELFHNPNGNKNFASDFLYKTYIEIEQEKMKCLNELSIEAGFVLLAYLEGVFRKDFMIRILRHKRKDQLSVYFLDTYKSERKLYQHPLEYIFKAWRNKGSGLSDKIREMLRSLQQYYDYRNWVAHGRYWEFKESNYLRKYCFEAILLMVNTVLCELNGKLLK